MMMIFSTAQWQNYTYVQHRGPIFCIKVSMSKFIKTKLDSTPLKNTVFKLLHLQTPYFYYFLKLKTKARYEISTFKLVLKCCETFAENYFKKLLFSQNWSFFMFPLVKTLLTEPKEHFSYTVESHLTVA